MAYDNNAPKVRERADIQLWIDGDSVMNVNDAYWCEPVNTACSIGCFWIGGSDIPDYEAGTQGVYIDDIDVADYNQTTSRWSVDFENGFTASSGTISISGGDVNKLCENYQPDVYVTYDSISANNTAYVGNYLANSYLNYSGLSDILGPDGIVSVDFKIDGEMSERALFFMSSPGVNSSSYPYWWIGLMDRNQPYIRCKSNYGDANETGEKNYYTILDSYLSDGWHTMTFSWQRTQVYDANVEPEIRERANLRLWIDSNLVITEENALWSRPTNTKATIGCFWLGGTSIPTWHASKQSILLDNITITP